jgi:hypothetical protein
MEVKAEKDYSRGLVDCPVHPIEQSGVRDALIKRLDFLRQFEKFAIGFLTESNFPACFKLSIE